MDELVYWIWLSLACTPATGTFAKLLGTFNNAREVYEAEDRDISRCVGQRTSDRTALLDKDLTKAEEIFDFCRKYKVGLLSYADERYPESLREIPTPPVLLYYRGILPDFGKIFPVAMVGTRSLSSYGRKHTFKIAYDLASAGAVIVSGMARGIDGVAMAGALAAGKPTVAVIGSGIDVCYPPEHLKLAREIVKTGCVLTEYPPKTQPGRYNFPARNRIISGLSAATIVMEGRERSGAIITARHAMDQNRVVYAFPGNVGEKNSEVTSLLIKNGAKLITSADDVVRDFENVYLGIVNPFNLPEKIGVDMMDTLYEYGISANCANDDIYIPNRTPSKPKSEIAAEQKDTSVAESADSIREAGASEPAMSFDAESLSVYKRIPATDSCPIESLVTDTMPLRKVMRCLLKLEMGRFVVMLPGERVARKMKL